MSRSLATVLTAIDQHVPTRGLFPGAALEHAKARLVKLLDATVVVRAPGRDANGGIIYEERPDNAIQLAAAVRLIELETGKAPQTVNVHAPTPGSEVVRPQDLVRMVLGNPGLARTIVDGVVHAAKQVQPEGADVPETPKSGGKGSVSESESAFPPS